MQHHLLKKKKVGNHLNVHQYGIFFPNILFATHQKLFERTFHKKTELVFITKTIFSYYSHFNNEVPLLPIEFVTGLGFWLDNLIIYSVLQGNKKWASIHSP